MAGSFRRTTVALGWVALFAVCIWAAFELDSRDAPTTGEIEKLFLEHRSGVMVEAEGTVEKLFSDDLKGSRHQRFLVRLDSGHTVLISHNIDLAPRVDALRAGDPIAFRGEYEWNDKGGVVHWTHHDPDGRHPGGWLRHEDRTYR